MEFFGVLHAINFMEENIRKTYTVKMKTDYMDILDDREFVNRFRLSKSRVRSLLEIIKEDLKNKVDRSLTLRPIDKILICLRFYATGCFQITVGDFGAIHQTTVGRVIKQVTTAIAKLKPTFICLPFEAHQQTSCIAGFRGIANFPRVIGALDCSHIKIQSIGGDEGELFRNRKGYFSLNVQAVCDSNLTITDVIARWPGSSHDSTIFGHSHLKSFFESGRFGPGVLLGDAGYPLLPYLMTPISQPNSDAERRYNNSQIKTRNTIERCFGVWKRRFPVLSIGMRVKIELVQDIIVATAVLHNIAKQDNIYPDDMLQLLPDEFQQDDEIAVGNNFGGTASRQFFINYFQNNL